MSGQRPDSLPAVTGNGGNSPHVRGRSGSYPSDREQPVSGRDPPRSHPSAPLRGESQSNGGVPRIALRREEAAAALGVSDDHFDARIKPELRVVRSGRLKLYPVAELERWATESAAPILEGER
jgi:hypothetical protein